MKDEHDVCFLVTCNVNYREYSFNKICRQKKLMLTKFSVNFEGNMNLNVFTKGC